VIGGLLGIVLGIVIGNAVSAFIGGGFIIPWAWMTLSGWGWCCASSRVW
jgi:putative ABC transport system permease protein